MLKCNCGWLGVNLVPDYENNKAMCPICNTVFQGIPAKNAIYTSREEEIKLQNKSEDFSIMFSELQKIR